MKQFFKNYFLLIKFVDLRALFRDTPILSEKLPVQLDLTLNHIQNPYKLKLYVIVFHVFKTICLVNVTSLMIIMTPYSNRYCILKNYRKIADLVRKQQILLITMAINTTSVNSKKIELYSCKVSFMQHMWFRSQRGWEQISIPQGTGSQNVSSLVMLNQPLNILNF